MSLINRGIVDNVGADYIETYLKNKGLLRTEDEKSMQTSDWVNSLLIKGFLDEEEFEKFLFGELLLGKRKLIRVYKLDNSRKFKYIEDWQDTLKDKYGLSKYDFSAILSTRVSTSEKCKIAAVHYYENEKGELTRIQLLFIHYIQKIEENGYRDSCAYIPVDVDFKNGVMFIKAWNSIGTREENRANMLLDITKEKMSNVFGILDRKYLISHQQVLFKMSKDIVNDIYNKIPAFKQISKVETEIEKFEQSVFKQLPIINLREDESGIGCIPSGVMDFKDEIRKAIERLTISDYFYDRDYEEIWDMGIDAIIARIKFHDNENILTSLSGENSEKPIFCTKTFMYLAKSMEDSKLVERLWIAKPRKKGKLNIRYDASNKDYLELIIGYNIRYTEEDLENAMETYREYEARAFSKITKYNQRHVS